MINDEIVCNAVYGSIEPGTPYVEHDALATACDELSPRQCETRPVGRRSQPLRSLEARKPSTRVIDPHVARRVGGLAAVRSQGLGPMARWFEPQHFVVARKAGQDVMAGHPRPTKPIGH